MNNVTPIGHGDPETRDSAAFQQNGMRPAGFGVQPETSSRAGADVDPMLAGAQVAISNLTSQVNRAYEELIERGEQLKRREDAARESEARAAQVLADAERDAQQKLADAQHESERMLEQAHQREAETIRQAESEAARVVERAHSIEGQVAQRLADLGRREQALNERDVQLAETAQRQLAEREWLNEYAQRLTGIASDLERALGETGAHAAG